MCSRRIRKELKGGGGRRDDRDTLKEPTDSLAVLMSHLSALSTAKVIQSGADVPSPRMCSMLHRVQVTLAPLCIEHVVDGERVWSNGGMILTGEN